MIDEPIFLVGMPRSGTTLLFEVLAAREDLGWFSSHLLRARGVPAASILARLADVTPRLRRSVSRSDQARPWLERFRVGPVEGYPLWERCCGEKFRYSYLLGAEATASERDCSRAMVEGVLRFQGKPRFAAKITGPARIGYLASIFGRARFIHVVRDGHAVVNSLLKVHFWRTRERAQRPAWEGGLSERDLEDWDRFNRTPASLAAIQWRRVVRSARSEAGAIVGPRYAEVHYERLVSEPEAVLEAIAQFCDLPPSSRVKHFLRSRFELRDMNFQWRDRFQPEETAMLDDLLADTLSEFGYSAAGESPPPLMNVPFGRLDQSDRLA